MNQTCSIGGYKRKKSEKMKIFHKEQQLTEILEMDTETRF